MSDNENIELTDEELGIEPAGGKPAKADKEKKVKVPEKKPGIFARIKHWFREMKSELKKVVWPTPKQTLNNTIVVIICVIAVGIFIWLFDALATAVVNALLHFFGKV